MNDGISSSQPSGENKGVKASSGAWKKSYPQGSNVAQLREQLSEYGSVPEGATAYSGTTPLTEDYVPQDGESITFVKKTGEKG